jgi:hypothetical protein
MWSRPLPDRREEVLREARWRRTVRGEAMAKLKAAFLCVASDAHPGEHLATTCTHGLAELSAVGVKNHQEAARVSRESPGGGVQAIGLCAGFGQVGVAKIAEVVGDKAAGVMHFDRHPALECERADDLFGEE